MKMQNTEKQIIIRKNGIAVFRDKKILMARSKKNPEVFYFPGGKMEAGETDIQCMERETMEELSASIDVANTKFLERFQEPAHNKLNILIDISLYETNLLDDPKPSSEVEEIRYFDSSIDPKHLDILGKKVFAWLKKNDYIR